MGERSTDEQVVDAAKWLQSLTPDQLAEARFYADVESFRRRVAELESELVIERGRVESWKKDSHVKEKLLNEKCEQLAQSRQGYDAVVAHHDQLIAEVEALKTRVQELEFDIECTRGGTGGLSKRDPS